MAGKTWNAGVAKSPIVGVDVVRQHRGLAVFGFSATVGTEICVCWKMCGERGIHVCPWIDEYDT